VTGPPRSFGTRLVLLVTAASGGAAVLVCLVLVGLNYRWMRDEAIQQLETQGAVIGTWTAAALAFEDADAGRETLRALDSVPGVVAATIFDADGNIFADYREDGVAERLPAFSLGPPGQRYESGWLLLVSVIREDGQPFGSLQMVYDMKAINARLRRNVLYSLGASLLASIVAMLIALRLEQVLTQPVNELVSTARRISTEKTYAARARKISDDELGQLTDAFNEMLDRIHEQSASLSAAHERFRVAVEAAPNAMVMVDERGTILLVNAQTERLFGYSRDELVGGPVDRLVPAGLRATQPGSRSGIFAEPQARPTGAGRDLHGRRQDGSEFPVEIGLNPIQTDDGMRVLSSIVDITERKRAEEERIRLLQSEREARAEAERASGMKDEFLATLSHELRTPLSAVLGWAQVLRRGALDPGSIGEGLEVIERNARAQAQIIEDLLDMSRIISGRLRLDVQLVKLAEVIEEALATVRPAAEAKGIRLLTVLDPHVGPVRGDSARLQQVVWNLLSNAIKFTPRGGRVQVALERVDSHLEISISDTGQGIEPEFLPMVFERFRQADQTTTRRHGGLGLGLALVKQFVELHGGSVQVQSPGSGAGSTFTVELPLAVVHEARRPDDTHPRVPRAIPLGQTGISLRGVRVLVVDDEADARELIRRLLEDSRAEVSTTGSAVEALDALDHFDPHVIVSDIGMPGRDGYDLIHEVRARGRARGGTVPAIALTAFARSEDRTRALVAGYQMHVAKPVEPSELIASVASLAGVMSDGGFVTEDGAPGNGGQRTGSSI
jgi:PAS domain S-box-containing protein